MHDSSSIRKLIQTILNLKKINTKIHFPNNSLIKMKQLKWNNKFMFLEDSL